MTTDQLDQIVTRILEQNLRLYVLQNSEGNVLESGQKLMYWEAERKNKKLAELNSDYRWSLAE